jgi:hypothetical protein
MRGERREKVRGDERGEEGEGEPHSRDHHMYTTLDSAFVGSN